MADKAEDIILYAATYTTVEAAEDDFELIKDLHKEKWVGKYEAALFTKKDDGTVKILDTDATVRAKGAAIGGAVGAAIGLVFPLTILAGALVGGGIGLAGGHLSRGLKRDDIKELGELLDAGEAGIVFVGVATFEEGLERFLKRAAKIMKKQVDADAEEFKRVIDESLNV